MSRPAAAAAARAGARALVVIIPVAFVGVFFVYPVASIIGRGLAPRRHLDLSPLGDVLSSRSLRHIIWFTVWQAVLSTLLTLIAALPAAYVLARYEFRGKRFVHALVTVPFVLPTVVVGAAFASLLRPSGPLGGLGLDQSLAAILVAHVFFNYAVVVRTVGGLWSHLDRRQEEAARVLGASRWRAFREVTLPALRPAIAAAASIVFLFTFTSFGVILILGGPRFTTLEVEIFRQTFELLHLPLAAALAIVQLLTVVATLVVAGRAQSRRNTALALRATADVARRPRNGRERATIAAVLATMAVLLGVPIAVLVDRSLSTRSGYGFGYYRSLSTIHAGSSLFVPPSEAIRNSLVFATAATVIALVVGGLASFALASRRPGHGVTRAGFDMLLMLPLGTSAVTIGFGFLIALDHPPLDLRTSPLLIPIAHALVAIPFVVRIMLPVLRSVDNRLREAASVLGASPARVWREVDLPIVARAALVAAGFAFAISLGEFGATIFIVRPDYPTLPVEIYRLLTHPGIDNFGAAMAASTILMVVTAAAVLTIERFRVRGVGEF